MSIPNFSTLGAIFLTYCAEIHSYREMSAGSSSSSSSSRLRITFIYVVHSVTCVDNSIRPMIAIIYKSARHISPTSQPPAAVTSERRRRTATAMLRHVYRLSFGCRLDWWPCVNCVRRNSVHIRRRVDSVTDSAGYNVNNTRSHTLSHSTTCSSTEYRLHCRGVTGVGTIN